MKKGEGEGEEQEETEKEEEIALIVLNDGCCGDGRFEKHCYNVFFLSRLKDEI